MCWPFSNFETEWNLLPTYTVLPQFLEQRVRQNFNDRCKTGENWWDWNLTKPQQLAVLHILKVAILFRSEPSRGNSVRVVGTSFPGLASHRHRHATRRLTPPRPTLLWPPEPKIHFNHGQQQSISPTYGIINKLNNYSESRPCPASKRAGKVSSSP